uniref:Protein tyrosine phosphatase receptor type N2 n=1 Tax=Pygocentrus nattereri TaxID=42514 RepID=A0AAR2LPU8_PYGNA
MREGRCGLYPLFSISLHRLTLTLCCFVPPLHPLCVHGMFGRCQAMTVADVYTYDITPATLQRFRSLLQKLSLRGMHVSAAMTTARITTVTAVTAQQSFQFLWQYCGSAYSMVYIRHIKTHMGCIDLRLCFLLFSAANVHIAVGNSLFCGSNVCLLVLPLSETFIRNVLRNVGKHNVDIESLSTSDLDQLAGLIADALQIVEQQAEQGYTPRDLEGEDQAGDLQPEDLQTKDLKPGDQDQQPGLLEYLDETSRSEAGPLVKGRGISVETVRSKTTQRDVGVQKKAMEQVEEVEGWVQAAAIAPSSVLQDVAPPHKVMKVQDLQLDVQSNAKNDVYGYIITDTDSLPTDQGLHLMELVSRKAKIQMTDFLELSVVGPAVTFQVRPNSQNVTTTDVANVRAKLSQIPTKYSRSESLKFLILTVISIICIIGVLLVSSIIYCLRHRSHHKLKEKLTNLGADPATEATATYQELCRQRMAVKPPVERPEPRHSSRINSVSSQLSDGPIPSPSGRTSTSSWSEEPAHSNMDISTGHMILSYMEDHLKNKNRLEKEWEALCAYQAEPNTCSIGQRDSNAKKNRVSTVIPYDHSRICLKVENSQGNSDYINASPIMDHDPRNPAYIATQGPLPSTVADFWQMVWESGCVVIVMLTPLTESGVKQCYHYWPDEGSNLYHIYEVNLVSEHVWCEDFLVRSFYLKNMQTNESRTVTQFHYHTWLNQHTPETNQALLDFRRKVNKCYRGRSCPIIVHCSDGAGRTGTYILIDMVLNKMAKGAKEIDIAATLEHLRDQRPGMVQTKEQFEFALTAVAEEVNAILKVLPQ